MSHWLQGLKARRIACNARPVDLARLIDVTPTSYHRYENGTRLMPLNKALMLADALGIKIDQLRYNTPDLETPVHDWQPPADNNPGVVVSMAPAGWDGVIEDA